MRGSFDYQHKSSVKCNHHPRMLLVAGGPNIDLESILCQRSKAVVFSIFLQESFHVVFYSLLFLCHICQHIYIKRSTSALQPSSFKTAIVSRFAAASFIRPTSHHHAVHLHLTTLFLSFSTSNSTLLTNPITFVHKNQCKLQCMRAGRLREAVVH